MKAVSMDRFGSVDELHWAELPTPMPKVNEVQIKIAFTAVNPVDWKICEGWLKKLLPHQFPLVPGWDAAGIVSAVGKDVTKFKEGDEVYAYCRKGTVQWGTYAEFVCFEAEHVAFKPKKLSFSQAAAIPLAGLTAWQALFDSAKLKSGETILIHAGAGGVGSFAIEFAKVAGAKIYSTASEKNHKYLKDLGCDVPIDYTCEDFVERIKEMEPGGVDVIFDCVGGDTLERSFDIVKKKGRLISIVHQIDQKKCDELNIFGDFVFVRPDGKQLEEIANLIDQGKVKVPSIEEMELSDYVKALEKSRGEHTCGKIVLRVMH